MRHLDLPAIKPSSGTGPATWLIVVVLTILTLLATGCSRVRLAYGTADFLITRYADDYLGLDSAQLKRWEPRLDAAIAEHRASELPHLAGFAEALRRAAQAGFPLAETRCLVDAFPELYRRHARLAVGLASPLLADLEPDQVRELGQRFADEAAEDRPAPDRDLERERRKRTKRWVEGIEDWTGPLSDAQKALIARITARMPDTTEAVYAYRTNKRDALMTLIRAGAGEARINRFLTDWLVDYSDLPATLERAQEPLRARIAELLAELGATLSAGQRARLDRRLERLTKDLMSLQRSPRMNPVGC